MNYWHQIDLVLATGAKRVLEIGPGDQTVTAMLRKNSVEVTTVDIDEHLKPDVVASVAALPFPDASFDLVLCSEVLEHIPYEEFPKALAELKRVSRGKVILGLPNAGAVFLFRLKLPLLRYLTLFTKIPFFWKAHEWNGEHYWETGKRGYGRRVIRRAIREAGFTITREALFHDDPAHWLLELSAVPARGEGVV